MSYSLVGGGDGIDHGAAERVAIGEHGVHILRVHNNWRENGHARKALGRLFQGRLCLELHV